MIKKHEASNEYYFEEGCHILETSNSKDDEEVSITQARVEKGQQTRWHYLESTSERYVILSGSGRVEVGSAEPQNVTTGDVVIIPQNTRQRIQNIGEDDLVFLAICSPRFQKQNYREGSI